MRILKHCFIENHFSSIIEFVIIIVMLTYCTSLVFIWLVTTGPMVDSECPKGFVSGSGLSVHVKFGYRHGSGSGSDTTVNLGHVTVKVYISYDLSKLFKSFREKNSESTT
jgi:hypothetical protein